MKKMNVKKMMCVVMAVCALSTTSLIAQEETEEAASSRIGTDAGVDVFSSYVWRGAKFGTGAAFQPWMEFTAGGLTIGSWGSVSTGGVEDMEMDLYVDYSFDFGLSVTFTDYYFGGNWMDFETMHFLEPAVSYSYDAFSFTGAYMFGEDTEDVYVELAYSFDILDVAVGAGDGAYTSSGDFGVCNVTLSKTKEIVVTESFSIPLVGAVTLNPYNEAFYVYAGISL
ncbi:MAG: hypothetical protein R6U95_08300 [Bacteroidales bacterium]